MFKKDYDHVVCKNMNELVFVNETAAVMHKRSLNDHTIMQLPFPVCLFLHGDAVGWNDRIDRIGNQYTFLEFVELEQNKQLFKDGK